MENRRKPSLTAKVFLAVGIVIGIFIFLDERYPPTSDLLPGRRLEQYVLGWLVTTDLVGPPKTTVVRIPAKGDSVPQGFREIPGTPSRDLSSAMVVTLPAGRRFDRIEELKRGNPWRRDLLIPEIRTVPMEPGYTPRPHYVEDVKGRVYVVLVEKRVRL